MSYSNTIWFLLDKSVISLLSITEFDSTLYPASSPPLVVPSKSKKSSLVCLTIISSPAGIISLNVSVLPEAVHSFTTTPRVFGSEDCISGLPFLKTCIVSKVAFIFESVYSVEEPSVINTSSLVPSSIKLNGSSNIVVDVSKSILSVVIEESSSVPVSCKIPPPIILISPVASWISVSTELAVNTTFSPTA